MRNNKKILNSSVTEQPKKYDRPFRKLIAYCKPFLVAIIIAMVFAVVSCIFHIIGPEWLRDIADIIQSAIMTGQNISITEIARLGTWLIVFYVLSAAFSYVQSYIMATVTQKITRNLRSGISTKINRLPLRYFDSVAFGDTLSRVTNDVDTIGNTLNQSIVSIITAVALLIGSVIMMFVTNAIMAISAIVASLLGFVLMSVIMFSSQKYFTGQQTTLGKLNGHIEEVYSGHNVVKVYNGERQVKNKFASLNNSLYKYGYKAQFLSGLMMPIMNFIGNFGYVTVCVVGGVLTFNGDITIGVILAFMMYINLFTQPLVEIAQAGASLQSTAAASGRVFEFLEEKEMPDESHKTKKLENIKGEIAFKNVQFGYDENRTIINNFSAVAKPGQKVAIVGPTGAGKTTMVNLLMHFYELGSGEITIDGVSTNDITRENIHDLFGMVLQDAWTFEGSIKDNIIYSKPNVSEDDVKRVCKAVGLHHFIKTLPNGYDQIIDDKANLSQGQKQLLTIARAMIENAPMLILDEATSSVDTRTEILIQKAMDKLMEGRTSFVIAHRLSTIKNADLILVMNGGDIVEMGSHDELLEKGGFYSELYNSQFEEAT